ncbi:MAG: GNAT family N-acetyltransferase [Deltaproteobacteria bacterium]|nr:GNAT family N-acetyltransferase [Deltaproteobacteria bacterium]MBI3386552.1 GNAT family N-acetyltransferase [Deltaproteobacteria bacterium]
MSVGICIASDADLAALVRLASAFRDHLGRSTPTEAEFRASIAQLLRDRQSEFFLARDGGGADLGYVQARYRHSAWTSGLDMEIEDVFVLSGARGGGCGRQLVEFAIARAVEKRCRLIGLNTNERNAGALALYRSLGFAAERALWNGARQLWLEKSLG